MPRDRTSVNYLSLSRSTKDTGKIRLPTSVEILYDWSTLPDRRTLHESRSHEIFNMSDEQCAPNLGIKSDEWMMAISTDNATKVDGILQNLPTLSTKSTLLHTQLYVLSNLNTANRKSTTRTPFLPFHFAVICHAKGVVRCMVQHGVDVTQIDDLGNNVLHTLINVSTQRRRKDYEYITDIYHLLMTLFSEHSVKFCLHHEDAKGLRPLELAASLGHFQLLNVIFHTPGVYLCKTEICGLQLLQYFRVTEYEMFSACYLRNRPVRDHLSPLRMIIQLGHSSVDMTVAKSALLCEPFSTWLRSKMQLNKWCVVLQSVTTHVETLLFFFVTRPQWVNTEVVAIKPSANLTNITMIAPAGFCVSVPDQNILALTCVICMLVISTLFNMYGLFNGTSYSQIRKKFTFQNITNSGDILMLELCTSTTMVVYCFLSIWLTSDRQVSIVVFQVTYMVIVVCSLRRLTRWGLVAESLRKYAMTVAAITSDFNLILCILLFFFLVCGAMLQHFHELDIPRNSWELSLSYPNALYTTFLVLCNTERVENIKTNYLVLLQVFHVTGYFSILVLLFNFLIASIVNTYSHIRSHFDVFCALYNLDTVFRCQDRAAIIARLYTHFMHKAFVVQNDEVYVVRLSTVNQF